MPLVLNILRRHWPAIAAFLVMLAVVCWSYLQGKAVATAECQARYEAQLAERDRAAAAAMAAALEEAQAQARAAMEAERQHLEAQAKTDANFRVITNTVTEYIHAKPDVAACSLDADGLRIWNSAHRGAAPGAADHP